MSYTEMIAPDADTDILTARELDYYVCETPMLSPSKAAGMLVSGFLIGILQAAFTPGYDKGDSRIIKASKLIRYTKYKKAVLRKLENKPNKRDEKLLIKLNKQPFIFDLDTDPDEFTRKIYEDYINSRGGS